MVGREGNNNVASRRTSQRGSRAQDKPTPAAGGQQSFQAGFLIPTHHAAPVRKNKHN